jgi:hypothetical protein
MQAERERERGEASEKEHRLNLQLRKSAAEADIMREQAKARLNEVLAEMAGLPKMIEEVRDNGASEKRRSDALMRRLETLEKVGFMPGGLDAEFGGSCCSCCRSAPRSSMRIWDCVGPWPRNPDRLTLNLK